MCSNEAYWFFMANLALRHLRDERYPLIKQELDKIAAVIKQQ